ncbi:MAG: glucosaminidase domain-containing protein [Treponema sp.]|nr:glucosaminidase domain-containing protein [Treponema sp.]
MKRISFSIIISISLFALIFSGCKSIPQKNKEKIPPLSRKLLDQGRLTAPQLAEFFLMNNPEEDLEHITQFAQYYIDESTCEGINSDAAFAQMCLETGFLRFGGLVQAEWHNYCGLGAMDAEHPGEIFETEELGVRAHIQHLQAYATTEDVLLNNELIDPRYNWVHKTKFVEDIWGLAGTWATDPLYGSKLNDILSRMEEME